MRKTFQEQLNTKLNTRKLNTSLKFDNMEDGWKNFRKTICEVADGDVKKVEKALKYELRRCEARTMDKIVKDLEDLARRHNKKILYWHILA